MAANVFGGFGMYYGVFVLLLGLVVKVTAASLNLANGRASIDEMAGSLV
jgi:hypothetical protein